MMITTAERIPGDLLTIGELARRTGISTHTLRMWEKRHGAPEAIRLPSGHRRYLPGEVARLQAVARALEIGYRAGKVVGESREDLLKLLKPGASPATDAPAAVSSEPAAGVVQGWLRFTKAFNGEALDQEFRRHWGRLGSLQFVTRLAAPFIEAIGREWQIGRLSVAQEHFATGLLGRFLAGQVHPGGSGPCAVLTTLPDERHNLGLMMCAAVLSVTSWRVVNLGLDVPEEEIARTMERCGASLLCVSVSGWYGPSRARPILWRLHQRLQNRAEVIAGGGGVPDNLEGIRRFTEFSAFYQWLTERAIDNPSR